MIITKQTKKQAQRFAFFIWLLYLVAMKRA